MDKGFYSKEDIDIMNATQISRNSSRIQELINFVKLNNYTKIGIASCISVLQIALKLKDILEKENFKVYVVDCKQSGLQGCDLSENLTGALCDPISQATYFNENNTDFNINFGLCLGHGLLFQKYSKAPSTTLLVKDACHKHNIMESFA